MGATYKRTADRVIASGTDILSLGDLNNVLQKNCPNDADISNIETLWISGKYKKISRYTEDYQVTGSVFLPNRIKMKSLSINPKPCLHVRNVYGSTSDSDDEPLASLKSQQYMKKSQEFLQLSDPSFCDKTEQREDGAQSSTVGTKTLGNGNFVLVKLLHRETKRCYFTMRTGVEEDCEVQVIFCKICYKTGNNFKIDDSNISFITWDQIIEELPALSLKMKIQQIFHSFNKSIDVIDVYEHIYLKNTP